MAKDKKIKIPKRIAGVKVPKKVRKTAKQALAIAENPAARELAVAALTAAAASIKQKNGNSRKAPPPAAQEQSDLAPAGAIKLGDIIAAAAMEGARRLLDAAATRDQDPEAAASAPKRGRSRASGQTDQGEARGD